MRLGLCGSWGCAEDASRVALDGFGAQDLLAIGSLAGGPKHVDLGTNRTRTWACQTRAGRDHAGRREASMPAQNGENLLAEQFSLKYFGAGP